MAMLHYEEVLEALRTGQASRFMSLQSRVAPPPAVVDIGPSDPAGLVKVTPHTNLGLYRYPWLDALRLEQVGRQWRLLSADISPRSMTAVDTLLAHSTIAWLKDDKVVGVEVEGQTTEQTLATLGLGLSTQAGWGKLSKRLSRLFRPFALFGWLDRDEVALVKVERGPVRSKSQDGAGWVSRRFLVRLARRRIAQERMLQPERRRALMDMARHAERVEATVQASEGQWKGHFMVVDTSEYDVRLIDGHEKREVWLESNRRLFVGFQPVHESRLFVDQQSLTNLNVGGFFSPIELVRWSREYLESFLRDFDEGRIVERILAEAGGLHSLQDSQKFLGYWLHEVVARGGRPEWFAAWTKAALQPGLEQVESRLDGRISLPIPGLNLYLMPGSVGGVKVQRGHVVIDRQRATAWFNDVDLVTLDQGFANVHQLQTWMGQTGQEPIEGLLAIWGGGDADDLVRLFPFTDALDGVKKVLVWRSPNKLGEFAVLKFQAGDDLEWVDGTTWPIHDSRLLPQPETWEQTKYLGLIRPMEGQPQEYDMPSVREMAYRMLSSQGAVGIYCLFMRFWVSTFGRLPKEMPCTVEQVMDAQAKDFHDTSAVVDWIADKASFLAYLTRQDGQPRLPAAFADEFERFLGRDGPRFGVAQHHWVDTVVQGVLGELDAYQDAVTQRAAQATPPAALLSEGMKFADAGRGLLSVWRQTWRRLLGEAEVESESARHFSFVQETDLDVEGPLALARREEQFDLARQACIAYLEGFDEPLRPMVMLGALAVVYGQQMAGRGSPFGQPEPAKDALAWTLGSRKPEGGREPGLMQLTLAGLQRANILGQLKFEDHRLIVSTSAAPIPDVLVLAVRGAWFNLGVAAGWSKGRDMAAIRDAERASWVERAGSMNLTDRVLEIDPVDIEVRGKASRFPGLFSRSTGHLLGTLHRDTNIAKMPKSVRILANWQDERDMLWLVCQPLD